MPATRRMLGLLMLSLTGCASSYAPPSLSPDHPANPDAASAPTPSASHTLALTTGAPPATKGGTDHAMHGDAHEATPSTADAANPTAANLYVCPMHEDFTSNDANARCPKCGMRLVKKPDGGSRQ